MTDPHTVPGLLPVRDMAVSLVEMTLGVIFGDEAISQAVQAYDAEHQQWHASVSPHGENPEPAERFVVWRRESDIYVMQYGCDTKGECEKALDYLRQHASMRAAIGAIVGFPEAADRKPIFGKSLAKGNTQKTDTA